MFSADALTLSAWTWITLGTNSHYSRTCSIKKTFERHLLLCVARESCLELSLAFHHLSLWMLINGTVPVEEGRPGLAAVLEPVVLALVSLQVLDEVVQEYDLLQFEQNLCGSLFWVSSVIYFYLNLYIFGDLP